MNPANSAQPGTLLKPDEIQPWDDPVVGATLLDDLRATLTRFLYLPEKTDVLISVWILHTYVVESFSVTPYLHITSPERECGKSTLADLLSQLCHKATTPGGMTAAAMYRRIEISKPTLLLDEWDTLRDETRNAALNVLNTGFKWNGVYTMCVGDAHEVRDFSTFCPKAIVGLSSVKLPDTTRSRCFPIELQRKPPKRALEKLTRDFDGSVFRAKCLRWVNDHAKDFPASNPRPLEKVSSRQEDISNPLLIIADACGGHWPESIRECVLHILAESKSDESDIGTELLKDLREILTGQKTGSITSAELVTRLGRLEDRPWKELNDGKGFSQRFVAERLRPYGIRPRDIWQDKKCLKGYATEDCATAFAIYVPAPEGAVSREAARKPENIGDSCDLASASKCESCETENLVPINVDGGSRPLADETGVGAADKTGVGEAALL